LVGFTKDDIFFKKVRKAYSSADPTNL